MSSATAALNPAVMASGRCADHSYWADHHFAVSRIAISLRRAGTAVRNRRYSPSFCARLPISGLRSVTLNGPPSEPRVPDSKSFTIAFCSGVSCSHVSGANRSPRRFRSRVCWAIVVIDPISRNIAIRDLDMSDRPIEKLDLARLERILGADDEQAVLLNELFEHLRAVPQVIHGRANVGAHRLIHEHIIVQAGQQQRLDGRPDAIDDRPQIAGLILLRPSELLERRHNRA